MVIPDKELEVFPSHDPLDGFEHIVDEAVRKRVGRKRLYEVLVSHGYTGTIHHAYYVVLKRRREAKSSGASFVTEATVKSKDKSTCNGEKSDVADRAGNYSMVDREPASNIEEKKIAEPPRDAILSSDDVAQGILSRVLTIGTKGLHNA